MSTSAQSSQPLHQRGQRLTIYLLFRSSLNVPKFRWGLLTACVCVTYLIRLTDSACVGACLSTSVNNCSTGDTTNQAITVPPTVQHSNTSIYCWTVLFTDSLFADPVYWQVIKCDLLCIGFFCLFVCLFVSWWVFLTLQDWSPISTWEIGNQPTSQHYIQKVQKQIPLRTAQLAYCTSNIQQGHGMHHCS